MEKIHRSLKKALQSFDYDVHKSAWADVANAAEEFNKPGEFTTFIGYEFTTSTDVEGGNLHRNVIFDSSKAPIRPWTRIDSLNHLYQFPDIIFGQFAWFLMLQNLIS